MIVPSCADCGTEISDGATRCRQCHRDQWKAIGPLGGGPEDLTSHTPGVLYTGSQLLDRIWGRPPAGRGGP